MKIKELYLKNFKSVTEQSFKFNDGITCFSGNNGEGKSTVIHAILILLFNSYDMSFKDYINWNASKFFISITFEHNGNTYYEEFEYAEKGGSKRLLKNLDTDEIWENSSAISILSTIINPDLAKASIVAMENEQNLITTTPAKRREYLKGLYNLEFKDQLDYISKDLEKISTEEIQYNADIAALEKQTFEYKDYAELEYSEQQYNDAKNEIEVLSAKKGELELQKRKRDEISDKLANTNLSIRKYTLQSSTINNKIRSIQEDIVIAKQEFENKQSEDKLPDLEDKLINLKIDYEKESSEWNANIDLDKKDIEALEKDLSIEKNIEEINTQIDEKTKEHQEIKILIKQSSEKLKVLKTGVCPTCGHVVSQDEIEHENITLCNLEQKEVPLGVEIDKLKVIKNKFIDQLTEKNINLNKLKSSLNGAIGYLSMVTSKFERESLQIQHEIEMYKSNKDNELSRIKSNIDNYNTLLNNQIEIKESTEDLLNQYRDDATKLSNELDSINDPTNAICSIDKEIYSYRIITKKYEDSINYNAWVDQYNKDQEEKIKRRDFEIEALKNQLSARAERKSMIEKAKSIVSKEFPSFVISYMVKSLENYTNEFLQKVYPKYKLKITESKHSLAITYGPNDADVKMASGFEKSAFSLAYMYALGKMQKYGILIIDEGDGAASDDNSILFYNTVAKSQEFFPQIFCITHKEVAKDLLQNTYKATVYTAESGSYYQN